MKMIVGLGNPGRKYEGTRHNVGFEVLRSLADKFAAPIPKAKFDGQHCKINMDGHPALLLWPLTYMNDSGRSVRATADFYKIEVEEDVLVICDDLSLPCGKLRARPKGSAGGQKGLADILRVFGTQQIARLRIGIDPTPPGWQTADYVLGKFDSQQRQSIDEAVKRACEAVNVWCSHDINTCMNQFN
ncbi:MAG: aminoacyl-tRNA hydrolase [Aureliella sp.]